MPLDLTDHLDEATKAAPNPPTAAPAIPIPLTLGAGLSSRVMPGSADPNLGFVAGPKPGAMPEKLNGPGRDASGIITADSAKAAMGNDMQRSGGIFGSIDMKGVNEIMARENAARQSMIDSQRTDNKPGGGLAILGEVAPGVTQTDRDNAEKTQRWALDDMASRMKSAGTRTERAALGQAMNTMLNNQVQMRGQDINQSVAAAQQGITVRGQDIGAQSDANRNAVTVRGQDIHANSDLARLGIDQQRLGIQQQDSTRAGEKWSIEKGIVQGQAQDAQSVRDARNELNAAITLGDPKKIEEARLKAVAAGIKFDKPNNEFTAVTDANGINITRTNKDTGAVDIIDGRSGALKASIAAPGAQQNPQQEYQAAIARAAGNSSLIAKINERAKANGVIK